MTAKQESVESVQLPVMEHFFTIQGEGFHQGKAAYFIRLGGCDVGCVWCDVKESWDASAHPRMSVQSLVDAVKQTPAELVVITGGEPLMHDLGELTAALQSAKLQTNIETSGSHPLSGTWDWICLSPKKFKAPLDTVIPHANELKVVIFNKSDFEWAEQYAGLVGPDCHLYLQPEWSKAAAMTPLIIDYVKQHPKWRIGLQVHKYLQVP